MIEVIVSQTGAIDVRMFEQWRLSQVCYWILTFRIFLNSGDFLSQMLSDMFHIQSYKNGPNLNESKAV